MIIYFLIVNILAASLFCYDKRAAIKHRHRIPEAVLHFTELIGGVFIIIPLMYIIRHKNRKFRYFGITFLIFAAWIGLLIWYLSHFNSFDLSMFDL